MRFAADRPLDLAPASASDYRELARRRLPRQLFDYIDGGAYDEADDERPTWVTWPPCTYASGCCATWRERRLATTVAGSELSMPVVLAPVGLAGMFAARAEVQAARAAEAAGIAFCESTVSICGIEEVRAASGSPFWFQLYVMRDRSFAEDLMARATDAGCPVLVLTVDLAVVGARHRDTRNGMSGRLPATKLARRGLDLVGHPGWLRDVGLGGTTPHLRQPGGGGTRGPNPRRLQGVGRRPVRSHRHLGRHRLGPPALERQAGAEGHPRP